MKIKTVLLSLFLVLANSPFAHALSWSLAPQTGSDQIRITNNGNKENLNTIRIDKNKILIQSKNFDKTPQLVNGNFVTDILPTEYGLTIQLKDSAFGFIQNLDKNGNLTVEIYKDPMGSRWKPSQERQEFNNEVKEKEKKVQVKLEELKQEKKEREEILAQVQDNLAKQKEQEAKKEKLPSQLSEVKNTTVVPHTNSVKPVQPVITENVNEKFVPYNQQTNLVENNKINSNTAKSNGLIITENTDNNSRFIPQFNAKENILVADNQKLVKENSLEKAKEINENELPTNTMKKGQEKQEKFDPKTFTPPSVSFKLNQTKPGEAKVITEKDLQNVNVKAEDAIDPDKQEVDNSKLIHGEAQELPLVIEDDSYDITLPTTQEELEELLNGKPQKISPTPVPGEILYVDEEGNPVPAPLDIPATIQKMRKAYNLSIFEIVLEEAEKLKDLNLPKNLLEEIYYNRAKAFFAINSRNLKEHGKEFIGIAQEALNMSQESTRKPEVLSNLAITHLALDAPQEAKAYTDILYKNYPLSIDTPNTILLLSDYYLRQGEYSFASKYLQILIDNYPDNTYAKDASLLQIKALYKLGNFDRTLAMIEFIDRKWPKVYLESSDYLMIKAHIQEDKKDYKGTIDTYWKLFNLDPKSEEAGDLLFKIANLYYDLGDKESAKKVLDQLYKEYPEHKLNSKGLLYVGENGRFDSPLNLDQTIQIFKQDNPVFPTPYYKKIIKDFPDSHEAILAKLRLGTLHYLEKEYYDAAKIAQEVFIANMDKNESKNASDLLRRSFDPMLNLALTEENSERVLQLWEEFPSVREFYEPITTELRMAMAKAFLNRDQIENAEKLLAPYLNTIPKTEQQYKDNLYAYDVFLAHAITKEDWNKVLELNEKIAEWVLPKNRELNKLYTTALAAENLGLNARALPIWETLAVNEEIPLYQRAYAQYFLARDAEKKQNLRGAYQANLDALAMFEDLRNTQSPYANAERERESIAALMDITEIAGRYTESMEWLNRYRKYVSDESEDYAGLQLREARLHRKMGDMARWRSILETIRKKEPDSVYGKMAASELNTYEMARDLNRFTGN